MNSDKSMTRRGLTSLVSARDAANRRRVERLVKTAGTSVVALDEYSYLVLLQTALEFAYRGYAVASIERGF
jgi:hypothetical protein